MDEMLTAFETNVPPDSGRRHRYNDPCRAYDRSRDILHNEIYPCWFADRHVAGQRAVIGNVGRLPWRMSRETLRCQVPEAM